MMTKSLIAFAMLCLAGPALAQMSVTPAGIGFNATSPVDALDLQNPASVKTAIHLLQSGIGEAGVGFKAGDSTFYITNEYGLGPNGLGNVGNSIALTKTGQVGLGTMVPMPGAKMDILGSVNIAVNNPTISVPDPSFPSANPLGLGVTATWDGGASLIGHAIGGYVVVQPGAPAVGSSYGVEGGAYIRRSGIDSGGILGLVRNDAALPSSLGSALWGIARDTANGGDNTTDAVRGTSEVTTGHIRSYLYGSGMIGVEARIGAYVENAINAGFQMGGPSSTGGGNGAIPTYPFVFYDNTPAHNRLWHVDNTGTTNAAAYKVAGTAGVTCGGPPSTSFASANGIVTHC